MNFYPDEEYEVVPNTEFNGLHNPFCYDATCPCHEDAVLIGEVAQAVQDGELTPGEATDLVMGKMV